MRYAIPILPQSLPLIASLNKGVTPEIEKEPTWFVFYTPEHPRYTSTIMTQKQMDSSMLTTPIPMVHCFYNQ